MSTAACQPLKKVVEAIFYCPLKVINNSLSPIVSFCHFHNNNQGGVFPLNVTLWTFKNLMWYKTHEAKRKLHLNLGAAND